MTFAIDSPQSNPQSNGVSNPKTNPVEPGPNLSRTQVERLLKTCDCSKGKYTAVAIGKQAGVSDTAVRKAYKALKQILSEGLLAHSGRYTELCKELMAMYFSRPETMNGAEWISQLQEIVGALPESVVSEPAPDVGVYWQHRQREFGQQSSALATRSQALLTFVKEQSDLDELGDDEAFEAELAAIQEQSYERELRRQVAAIEGRNRARQDVRQGA